MTAFSLSARLNLGANSDLALSLPQSFVAAKRRQKPAPSSEGAEAAAAASHRFSFTVKVRSKRYTLSQIQPLSRLRRQLPLHRGAESALHLHQCGTREPRRLPPQATELQGCEPWLSPLRRAALIRHGAAQKRSTAPPSPRGRRGGCRRKPQNCKGANRRSSAAGGAKAVFPKGKGFSPHKFAVFVAPGRVFCYNTFNNTQNAQKGLFV